MNHIWPVVFTSDRIHTHVILGVKYLCTNHLIMLKFRFGWLDIFTEMFLLLVRYFIPLLLVCADFKMRYYWVV